METKDQTANIIRATVGILGAGILMFWANDIAASGATNEPITSTALVEAGSNILDRLTYDALAIIVGASAVGCGVYSGIKIQIIRTASQVESPNELED